ncbi:hypothetical protein [Paraburkholderia sp. BL21I4N1]|uniref:hypothetical protein n=1 Tax=Paraburkholderia sp. BL21I4N1 TaxID=1938801 RepID=UPI000D4FDA3A|nr:hypothetical protein [Paraburkholderia sp. BL21I4N1]PQV54081.1 hypothetical protein B0G83_101263 [Paraburkholderia sp. BL21I4N1]
MLNRKYVAFGGAFVLLAGAVIVHACGPFFPLQLLDNRAGTLSGTPNNSFAYEVARLVTPGDHLLAPEAVPVAAGAQAADPAQAVLSGLTPAQIATLAAMAKANDGDAAYALGAGVPDAQRLYGAADVDYTHALTGCASTAVASAAPGSASAASGSSAAAANAAAASATPNAAASSSSASDANASNQTAPDPSNASSSSTATTPAACASKNVLLTRAATRLEAIFALPGSSSAPRSVAAATELAAIAQARADSCTDAGACKTLTAALPAAYARPRTLAANGAPDPQGLAVASFGDEALTYLYDQKSDKQCDYRSFLNDTPCAAAITPANLKRAIGLYAQQAARGGVSGVESLQFIAAWALAGKTRVASLIDDPIAQRLLVAYALAREGDIVNDQPASASEYYGGYDNSFGPTGYADAARGDKGIKANPALVSLVESIRQRGIDHVAGADRLAALAYRVGRYDFAGMLAAREHSALASWVSAKLALRRGDTAAAVQAYAQASKGFPTADSSVEPAGVRLIKGEQAVLTLSRGQYVEALGYLFDAASRRNDVSANEDSVTEIAYGSDMAYIAERVLTTDELKHFVDTRVPTWSAAPPLPTDPNAYYSARPSAGDSLRYLLARRLVREGRIDDALPYFPADDDPRYSAYDWKNGQTVRTQLHLRELAHDYGAALDQTQHAWTRTNRARGWFAAATLAKQFGMELMGYEQGPDYHDIDGDFEGGSGRSGVIGARVARGSDANAASDAAASASAAKSPDTPATRAADDLAGPFVTADEKRRYAASESQPLTRFHYREIAAGYIAKAADALPARSQAFAAVLCRGTDWMHNYDPERAQGFYKRYVKEGAYVDFGGGSFGALCPEPDFKAAATFTYTQAWRDARRDVGRHKKRAAAIGGLVLAGLMGVGWWWYRRRTARRTAAGRGE